MSKAKYARYLLLLFEKFYLNPTSCVRALATIVSGAGVLLNSSIAVHLITLWHSLKWDSVESEWESTSTFGGIDSVKLAWSLLSLYFSLSVVLSIIGFLGSVKVRKYLIIHAYLRFKLSISRR